MVHRYPCTLGASLAALLLAVAAVMWFPGCASCFEAAFVAATVGLFAALEGVFA